MGEQAAQRTVASKSRVTPSNIHSTIGCVRRPRRRADRPFRPWRTPKFRQEWIVRCGDMPSVLPLPYGAADSRPRRRRFNARTGSRSDFPLLWRGGARRARECSTAGGTAADPVSVRLTPIFPSASVPHCSRRAIFRRRGTNKPSGDGWPGRAVTFTRLQQFRETLTPVLLSAGRSTRHVRRTCEARPCRRSRKRTDLGTLIFGTALCAGTCWASNSARGVLEIDIPRHHVSLCQLLANACMAASRVGS